MAAPIEPGCSRVKVVMTCLRGGRIGAGVDESADRSRGLRRLCWACAPEGVVTTETRGGRKPWEVGDGLWERIEPLLPVIERRFRYPGRRRLDDRRVLCGILFVLYTGIPWRYLPQELGYGSG